MTHIRACAPWLGAELAAVQPAVAVALGATAARSLLGRPVAIREERGRVVAAEGGLHVVVTSHPSAVLRLRGRPGFDEAMAALVRDLRAAAAA